MFDNFMQLSRWRDDSSVSYVHICECPMYNVSAALMLSCT